MPRMMNAAFLRPLPGPREVHLWCLFPEEVRDSGLLQAYNTFLCPAEHARIAEARTPELKQERLLTQTLVRTTLAGYCGGLLEPSGLSFVKNKYGKPQVDWQASGLTGAATRLQYNLSHTSSLIACGLTLDSPIGLDVEEVHRDTRRDVLAVARRRFSPEEADWLEQVADLEERRLRFVQLWTLKEAYVKALGKGIQAAPLRQFSFKLQTSPAVRAALEAATDLHADNEAKEIIFRCSLGEEARDNLLPAEVSWRFFLLQPTPRHYAALCVGEQEDAPPQGDEIGVKPHLKLKVWRTVPLQWSEPLCGDALALGSSRPFSC